MLVLSSATAGVLTEGRLLVHPIEVNPGHSLDEFDTSLPPSGAPQGITCAALTSHFAITGAQHGTLCYYLVNGLASVNEFRHSGVNAWMTAHVAIHILVFSTSCGHVWECWIADSAVCTSALRTPCTLSALLLVMYCIYAAQFVAATALKLFEHSLPCN